MQLSQVAAQAREHDRLAASHAPHELVAGAQRLGQTSWPIHHLDEIGVVVAQPTRDLWIEAARISSTCSDSSM